MKILFISSLNLATNPRFVKEIKLALANGYEADVLCFEFNNWSYAFNQQIKKDIAKANIYTIPAGRKPFWSWAISVFLEKIFRVLGQFIPLPLKLKAIGVSRRSLLLIKNIRKLNTNYNMVIGHVAGALYPTYFASKYFGIKAGFDIEDYHPGEDISGIEKLLTKALMQKILPKMDYLSFAAPLIRKTVEEDCKLSDVPCLVVMNYFSANEFSDHPKNLSGTIKFVWFSQNIKNGRGLELILPSIKKYSSVELHLFGNLDAMFYNEYLQDIPNIFINDPLPQMKLHKKLGMFDVGLALEPAKDRNNELAVSNKILAYLQAGLFVLASNTPAQKEILAQYSNFGYYFDYITNDSEQLINKIIKDIQTIRNGYQKRFKIFAGNNWETESEKLLQQWKKLTA